MSGPGYRRQAGSNMRFTGAILLGALVLQLGSLSALAVQVQEQSKPPEPLTYRNVISFFRQAQFRATEVQPRCTVFFEGEWKSSDVYDYCLIIVEKSDQDIQVTFYLTDAHEMNWVTEFLDSRLFAPRETQSLFGLMNADKEVRRKTIGRFRVDYHHWQPRHAQILVFSFVPR
jgi:hypothetical protein